MAAICSGGRVRAMRTVLASAVLALVLAVPAQASFPGRNGSIAFDSYRHGTFDIYLVSPGGAVKRLTTTAKFNETNPAWSASGKKIAYERRDFRDPNHPGLFEIWVMNADGSHKHRVARGTEPAWSPNGKKIAYVGSREPRVGRPDIWVMNSDGSHQKRLTSDPLSERSPDWSPDGKWVAFATDRGNSHDIWKMRADGSAAVRLTSLGPYDDQPSWSPSGKKIAYVTRDAAGYKLMTMKSNGSAAAPVGTISAYRSAWSPDGKQIAYEDSDQAGGAGEIFRVGLSGLSPVNLTANRAQDDHPSWQPLK
jgi:Tol biopolymer transport system component